METLAAPIISFVVVLLVLAPLPFHIRSKNRNIALLCLALWIIQWNFFQGINCILWNGNVVRKWLVYCDITLALKSAGVFGMVAANMCILRHLEHVSSPAFVGNDPDYARQRTRFEIILCVVCPFIFAACQVVIVPNRFYIFEDLGCVGSVWISWPALVLWYFPPLIMALTTFTYAFMTVKWLILSRRRFNRMVLSHSGMSNAQFIRLLLLATILAVSTAWTCIFQVIVPIKQFHWVLAPYVSWSWVHEDFWHVYQFRTVDILPFTHMLVWIFFMLAPYSGLLFFLLFGLGGEPFAALSRSFGGCKRVRRPHVGGSAEPQRRQKDAGRRDPPSSDRPRGFIGELESLDEIPTITIEFPHTSLLGSEPGLKLAPSMSARARWLAGADLDFQDSGSEDGSGDDEVIDIEASGSLSIPERSSWRPVSSSFRPSESNSAETTSLQALGASFGESQSDGDTPSSEVQELEVPLASSASDSTYYGTDEFFDISARAGVAAAESRILASQRFSKDQPSSIHISPAFPPSPPLPPLQLNRSLPLSSSLFASPLWARERSHTEPGPKPRTPPRVRGLPSSPAPVKQVHFLQPTFPPRTALTAKYRERILRPSVFALMRPPGFEPTNRHDRRRTTSYSFI